MSDSESDSAVRPRAWRSTLLLMGSLAAGALLLVLAWLLLPTWDFLIEPVVPDVRDEITQAIEAATDPAEQAALRLDLAQVRQEDDRRRSDLRTGMFQIFTAGTVIVGGVTAWIQLRQLREDRRNAQDQAALETAAQAVDQLANDSMVVRMGGIATLGDLPRLSPSRLPVVIDLLAAFVREHRQLARQVGSDGQDAEPDPLIRDNPDVQLALSKLIDLRPGIGVVLAGAPLRAAELQGADLRDADLRYVDLSFANLANANFGGTDLSEADLRFADFTRADLSGADLRRATLVGARLTDTDLKGADLRNAILDVALLRGATADAATRWPKGFDPEAAGVIFVDRRSVGE